MGKKYAKYRVVLVVGGIYINSAEWIINGQHVMNR